MDPVEFELNGDSTFKGNLTLEHGDLNLVNGQLTLKDMNFGKVRSLSFNKASAWATRPHTKSISKAAWR